MPIIASLIKIAVLALALFCVDIKLTSAPVEKATDSRSWHSTCRIYFGCAPTADLTASSSANSERHSR
jgi:hypothetical protein